MNGDIFISNRLIYCGMITGDAVKPKRIPIYRFRVSPVLWQYTYTAKLLHIR